MKTKTINLAAALENCSTKNTTTPRRLRRAGGRIAARLIEEEKARAYLSAVWPETPRQPRPQIRRAFGLFRFGRRSWSIKGKAAGQ